MAKSPYCIYTYKDMIIIKNLDPSMIDPRLSEHQKILRKNRIVIEIASDTRARCSRRSASRLYETVSELNALEGWDFNEVVLK